jgi:monoterpene epsilon-lactone hydrolase
MRVIDRFRFAPWVSAEAVALFKAESMSATAPDGDIAALRLHYDAFNRGHLEVALRHYPVEIAPAEIAGIGVHIVTPPGGARDARVLLCLHGGAFMWGRGAGALLEAVPVAAASGMRVIAVEYALAPEHIFPAAVEDVLAVYAALRDKIPAHQIGIYGCSAGGILTAQAVARLIADGLPLPGAIAMLCGTGLEIGGDSLMGAGAFTGQDANGLSLSALPHLANADPADPLVFPGEHPAWLAQFPPSLLITGTRDFAASAVTVMHRRLLAAGAEAALIMFDGMWHAHHMATSLPESRETFAALTRFFAKHLAR